MTFLEKDLEDIIFQATREQLKERNLFVRGKRFRQFKVGNYGITDLVTIERPYYHTGIENHCKGTITIYELKKDSIGINTFNQLIRYANGIKLYLEERDLLNYYNISLVAIGKDIDLSTSFCYLPNLFNQDISEVAVGYSDLIVTFNAYKYSYNFDGISFDKISGYHLENNGF